LHDRGRAGVGESEQASQEASEAVSAVLDAKMAVRADNRL
jgi:hypothetical protein